MLAGGWELTIYGKLSVFQKGLPAYRQTQEAIILMQIYYQLCQNRSLFNHMQRIIYVPVV